jgi:hypothetical protein
MTVAGIARVRSTTSHSSRIICVSAPTADTGFTSLCVLTVAPLSWVPNVARRRRANMSELP